MTKFVAYNYEEQEETKANIAGAIFVSKNHV